MSGAVKIAGFILVLAVALPIALLLLRVVVIVLWFSIQLLGLAFLVWIIWCIYTGVLKAWQNS